VPLGHDEIRTISEEVIRRFPRQPVEFVGVMASEGGSGRVEVMVTITGCHATPCQLILNLSRQNRDALERELRRALEAALETHIAS
jgi:hypothetical protein